MREELYIIYRKILGVLNRICFYACRIFPIKKNRVAVCTFEGKGGFGCNPKYIVEELHRRRPDLEFVWLVNNVHRNFPDYIKGVSNSTWSRAYWMSTAKVWIDNYRVRYGTVKRKGQYYLNTNHYTIGIKRVGMWRGDGFSRMAYLVSKSDSDMIDEMLSDSSFCDEMYPKGLLYSRPLKKTGSPRCDVLYGDKEKKRKQFRDKYGLSADARIVMYAPTFRESSSNGKRSVHAGRMTLDFKRLLNCLSKRFGGEWQLCLRLHPQLIESYEINEYNEICGRLIDETHADDLYETLAAMDAYITDYSSACFEAGLAEIPVFVYADDLSEYKDTRGGFFWEATANPDKEIKLSGEVFQKTTAVFPFQIAHNNDELERNILLFNEDLYKKAILSFRDDLDIIFDGKASIRAADLIISNCRF